MKKRSLFTLILLALLISLIWGLSMQDATASNQVSKEATRIITTFIETFMPSCLQVRPSNSMIRDLAHISLFFLLGLVSMLGWLIHKISYIKAAFYTLLMGILIAFCDELIQLGSAGRAFEWIDMGKDLFGILVSILIAGSICFFIILVKKLFKKL